MSVTPAAALSFTVTAVPAASRPVSNPASPIEPPSGDGNDQSPRETAAPPETVVVAAYVSALVAVVTYETRTSYRASTSVRHGVKSNSMLSAPSPFTVTADAATEMWSLTYSATSTGNALSHARTRSFCAYDTSCEKA